MTTLNLQVGASADDAHEQAGVVTIDSGGFTADAENEWIGFRFQNVTIPQGAVIESAILALNILDSLSDEPSHRFDAEASDNAAAFTTGASDISGRTLTGQHVDWNSADLGVVANEYVDVPDLATPVQAVIDRAGWASGNAVVITAHTIPGTPSPGSRDLGVNFWDLLGTARSATLDITYSVPQLIRPDATDSAGNWTAQLSGTLHANTADDDDATYAELVDGDDPSTMVLGFGAAAEPDVGDGTLTVRVRRID